MQGDVSTVVSILTGRFTNLTLFCRGFASCLLVLRERLDIGISDTASHLAPNLVAVILSTPIHRLTNKINPGSSKTNKLLFTIVP